MLSLASLLLEAHQEAQPVTWASASETEYLGPVEEGQGHLSYGPWEVGSLLAGGMGAGRFASCLSLQ
jgi:hypothetical protein